mmetsp:Transcript_44304/g.100136  ORF Transcript_44304/g.100136 Transcript_44304/m.100136 type:complete len:265 (-) Transcript_44304:332-1126(-)
MGKARMTTRRPVSTKIRVLGRRLKMMKNLVLRKRKFQSNPGLAGPNTIAHLPTQTEYWSTPSLTRALGSLSWRTIVQTGWTRVTIALLRSAQCSRWLTGSSGASPVPVRGAEKSRARRMARPDPRRRPCGCASALGTFLARPPAIKIGACARACMRRPTTRPQLPAGKHVPHGICPTSQARRTSHARLKTRDSALARAKPPRDTAATTAIMELATGFRNTSPRPSSFSPCRPKIPSWERGPDMARPPKLLPLAGGPRPQRMKNR